MIQNKQFSGKRIVWLLRNDLLSSVKIFLITAGTVIGILLIVNIASAHTYYEWNFHSVFYPVTFLICGLITTSTVFRNMHKMNRGYQYLTLPASTAEKFLEKLILTTVGFTIFITAGYFIFSLLSAGLTTWFFGISHGIFNPFSGEALYYMALYIVMSSVIFFGAAYFRKLSIMKTLLSLFGLAFVFAVIALIAARLIFWKYFVGMGFFVSIDDSFFNAIALSSRYQTLLSFSNGLSIFIRILFWAVMPLFFWFLGFLRIREKEVM